MKTASHKNLGALATLTVLVLGAATAAYAGGPGGGMGGSGPGTESTGGTRVGGPGGGMGGDGPGREPRARRMRPPGEATTLFTNSNSSFTYRGERPNQAGLTTAGGSNIEDCVARLVDETLFWAPAPRTLIDGTMIDAPLSLNDVDDVFSDITPVSDGFTFFVKYKKAHFVAGVRQDEEKIARGWVRLHQQGEAYLDHSSRRHPGVFLRLDGFVACSIKLNRNSRTPMVNLVLWDTESDEIILTLGQGVAPNTLP